MSNTNPNTPREDVDVPVRTKLWCTLVMVPCAGFMCLLHDAFANAQYGNDTLGTLWTVLGALVAILSGFILVARNEYPEPIFVLSCILVVIFPFDSLIVLMSLTSLLARRTDRRIALRAIPVAAGITPYGRSCATRDVRRMRRSGISCSPNPILAAIRMSRCGYWLPVPRLKSPLSRSD